MNEQKSQQPKIFDQNCIDITGVSVGLIESLEKNFDKILPKGLTHILDVINRSLPKSSFYYRKTQDWQNPNLRSRFGNLKDEYFNYAANISLMVNNLEITMCVFLNHEESVKIINKIESLLNLAKSREIDSKTAFLLIATMIGILGTCHIYPDGNGRTLLVLAKILIKKLVGKNLDLTKVHQNNPEFTQIMTICSLTNLPENAHPNTLSEIFASSKFIKKNQKVKISYVDLIADDTEFFVNYRKELESKLTILKGILDSSTSTYIDILSNCLPEYQNLQVFLEENCQNE